MFILSEIQLIKHTSLNFNCFFNFEFYFLCSAGNNHIIISLKEENRAVRLRLRRINSLVLIQSFVKYLIFRSLLV